MNKDKSINFHAQLSKRPFFFFFLFFDWWRFKSRSVTPMLKEISQAGLQVILGGRGNSCRPEQDPSTDGIQLFPQLIGNSMSFVKSCVIYIFRRQDPFNETVKVC